MRRYRLDNNLKQEELAEKLGISQQLYSSIERGEPKKLSADFVLLFRKVTGVNLMDENSDGKINASPDSEVVKRLVANYNDLNQKFNDLFRLHRKCSDEVGRLKKAMKRMKIRV